MLNIVTKIKQDGIISTLSALKINLQILLNSDINKPKKKIYVDPSDIKYYRPSLFDGGLRNNLGIVKGGKWDKKRYPIKRHHKYKICKQRAEGRSWEEIDIIDHVAERLDNGDIDAVDGCESGKELLKFYKNRRENLFQTMKSNGFNEELSDVCCRVHIGRDGELILASGGRHRLFFSKVLELNEIPVRILWRHQKWQSIREKIENTKKYDSLSGKERIYVQHPDVQEFIPDNWTSE